MISRPQLSYQLTRQATQPASTSKDLLKVHLDEPFFVRNFDDQRSVAIFKLTKKSKHMLSESDETSFCA